MPARLATERTLMLPEETFKDFPAQYTSDGFYRKLRKAHSINHGLGPGFNTPEDLKDLCRHMSMHRAAQDDQVLTEGQLTSSMVFLLEGEIQLKFTSNLKRATELDTVIRQQGMWVGDDAFFTALYKGKGAGPSGKSVGSMIGGLASQVGSMIGGLASQVGSMIGGLSMFFSSATRTQTMKADGDDCIMAVFPLDTFHQLNREQPLLGYKLLKICMAEAER
eukprot:gene3403-4280_t